MNSKRFDFFFEKHIGFGVRWDSLEYQLHLSFAFPFITITIGLGKKQNQLIQVLFQSDLPDLHGEKTGRTNQA